MTEDHLHHREKFVVSLDILIDNYEVKNVKKKEKEKKRNIHVCIAHNKIYNMHFKNR